MRVGDPIRKLRFRIECDGEESGGFSEVAGFDIPTDSIEYGEKDETIPPGKLHELTKYGNITLKYGIVDQHLYAWIVECASGTIERKSLTVNVYGEENSDTVIASWTIENAWPVKYSAPELSVTGNDMAVKSLEIAHESLKRTM